MHKPRKRFGQNFLRDQSVIQRIVETISPKLSDHLIEIGPGLGALTFPLLKKIDKLDVIEIDRDLVLFLKNKAEDKLTIYEQDALQFDFSSLSQKPHSLRIVGNLPYNISTPLIFHLIGYASIISDMIFMLQKEVVERMAAAVDADDYGRLSVMVQYHCLVEALFDVSPDAFNPPPQVTSTIVRLVPYEKLPHVAKNYAHFAEVVKQAFSQRRKTLRNSLKKLVSDEDWKNLKINPELRAEKLSVEDFVKISNSKES